MLREAVLNDIAHRFGKVTGVPERLQGGDINEVYCLSTPTGKLVVKTHHRPFPGMYVAEAGGLRALSETKTFRIPQVLHVTEDHLVLEYIPQGDQRDVGGEILGQTLAGLHQTTSGNYGWKGDNYIGSLPQTNTPHPDGVTFYREERLQPQFKLAGQNGFTFRHLDTFLDRLDHLIPQEPASLIHGDLWSGNYMVSDRKEPCLIDPAAAYANREMDLAMMALFGGFPRNHIAAYEEVYPLQPDWEQRIPLWQLYYILVHLNLFGAGYYSRCVQIMKGYL